MGIEQPTAVDEELMDRAIAEARAEIARGRAGVAAILAHGREIVTVALNRIDETSDMTDHAEMVALRQAAKQLAAMDDERRRGLTIYVTLEPCLMCASALSFVGIRRVAYAATAADANLEELIVRDLDLPAINERLVRGPFALLPGLRRAEGQELLRAMGKAAGSPPDLKT